MEIMDNGQWIMDNGKWEVFSLIYQYFHVALA